MTYYQCYHAFTSRRYRLITFVLVPAGLLLTQALFLFWAEGPLIGQFANILAAYFTVTDIWVFGESCMRREAGSEYLKSSVKGTPLLRKVLISDCLTRFGLIALILNICIVMSRQYTAKQILRTALAVCVSYSVSSLCILLCRYFGRFLILAVVSAELFVIPLILLVCGGGSALIVSLSLAAAASVGFSVLIVRIAMMNIRRSYYDKTVEI